MSRCLRTWDLEVHHKNVKAGNELDNAVVLCHKCHVNTASYGDTNHKSPEPFSQETKDKALRRANYQCECTKGDCCF